MIDIEGILKELAENHNCHWREIEWYSWPQVFGTTAGPGAGSGVIAGQGFTTFQVYAFNLPDEQTFKFCAGYWKQWNGVLMERW